MSETNEQGIMTALDDKKLRELAHRIMRFVEQEAEGLNVPETGDLVLQFASTGLALLVGSFGDEYARDWAEVNLEVLTAPTAKRFSSGNLRIAIGGNGEDA